MLSNRVEHADQKIKENHSVSSQLLLGRTLAGASLQKVLWREDLEFHTAHLLADCLNSERALIQEDPCQRRCEVELSWPFPHRPCSSSFVPRCESFGAACYQPERY